MLRLLASRTVGCVLVLVAVELALAAAGFGDHMQYRSDPRLGQRMLPRQHTRFALNGVELRTNSRGYRDREWRRERDDALRIAAVGNSVTLGAGVPEQHVWPRRLELLTSYDREARDLPREVVVMNFAVAGYRLEQMLRTYEDDVRPYDPDVLIVPLLLWDVLPMNPPTPWRDFGLGGAYRKSATYQALAQASPLAVPPVDAPGPVRGAEHRALTADPMGPESRHLWDRAAERMEAIHRMLARDGGQLVLVVVPMMRHLVEPGYFDAADFWRPWAEAQRALPGSQPVIVIDPIPRFAELQRELAAELVAADIASVETVRPELLEPGADGAEPIDLPDLRALAHREQSLFNLRDLVHFTARGHHAFGQQVYRGLRDAGILDPR